MSSTFRAAVVRTPGGPDSIEFIDVPVREPGSGEVRIAVAAAPVNPADLAVAGGFFHGIGLIRQPRHTGLGWDVAGTVSAVGPDVDLPVGTRVAGLVAGFDRDFGTYAEQLVLPAADVAVVPDELALITAATVPLNGLAAAQLVDLLGHGGGRRLLVTGAAGAVGAFVVGLAQPRGWEVTGLARPADEAYVRSLGAGFTADAEPGWDAVADAAALEADALALVADGGTFAGVRPGMEPPAVRGITVQAVDVRPDGGRLADLLRDVATGALATRVHAVVPLADVADAHRTVAKGGVRGRIVLQP